MASKETIDKALSSKDPYMRGLALIETSNLDPEETLEAQMRLSVNMYLKAKSVDGICPTCGCVCKTGEVV